MTLRELPAQGFSCPGLGDLYAQLQVRLKQSCRLGSKFLPETLVDFETRWAPVRSEAEVVATREELVAWALYAEDLAEAVLLQARENRYLQESGIPSMVAAISALTRAVSTLQREVAELRGARLTQEIPQQALADDTYACTFPGCTARLDRRGARGHFKFLHKLAEKSPELDAAWREWKVKHGLEIGLTEDSEQEPTVVGT